MLEKLALLIRLIGDGCHSYAMFLLIQKIMTTRSCSGLSYKTQILYLIVFVTRYLDIFGFKFSRMLYIYLFFMKIIYISFQAFSVYLMRVKYFYTYDKRFDTVKVEFLIIPSLILPFFFGIKANNFLSSIVEYLWCFSVVLESVSILPQLVLLRETGEAEVMTSRYIFCLGIYRLFYLVNWALKKLMGESVDTLMICAGVLQTILYADFFVLYYRYVFSKRGKENKLPY